MPEPALVIESIDVPISDLIPVEEISPVDMSMNSEQPAAVPVGEDVLVVEAPVEPKPMYITQCAVCREDIQVPFQPDGKRPTFCRDHLKEYQRLAAKAREETRPPQPQEFPAQPVTFDSPVPISPAEPPARQWQQKTYSSPDRPMSLYQMQHVAPKQFKSNRPRPDIENIRNLLPKRGE